MNTQTKQKDYTLHYSLIPGFFWMSYASVISYASFYLLSKGFNNTQIGVIVAIAGAIAAILQPIVASYADTPKSPSLKKIILCIDGAMLLNVAFLLVCAGNGFAAGIGVLYAGLIILLQIQTPLINAMGTECINQGKKLNYGASRAMGSLGYAIMAFMLGIVTVKVGSIAVPIGTAWIYTGLVVALLAFPFQKSIREEQVKVQDNRNAAEFFVHYKKFTLLLAGCVLIYISHALINNFTLQIVQNIGGSSKEMGFAQALASLLELPTLLVFALLLKIKHSDFWFKMAAVFFFIKNFATFLSSSLTAFYLTQLFQTFGWGLMMASSVYYVNAVMEESDRIKGQAYMTMTITLGTVLGALLGGTLLDHYSVKVMLLAGNVCALAGVLIIWSGAEKTKL